MTPTEILTRICEAWDIDPAKITWQADRYTPARYAYFFMMTIHTELPYRVIGELNGRNYTRPAVSTGIKRHHQLMASDADYRSKFESITRKQAA